MDISELLEEGWPPLLGAAQLGGAGQAGDGAGPGADAASACPRGAVTRTQRPTWRVRLHVWVSLLGSELETGSAGRK